MLTSAESYRRPVLRSALTSPSPHHCRRLKLQPSPSAPRESRRSPNLPPPALPSLSPPPPSPSPWSSPSSLALVLTFASHPSHRLLASYHHQNRHPKPSLEPEPPPSRPIPLSVHALNIYVTGHSGGDSRKGKGGLWRDAPLQAYMPGHCRGEQWAVDATGVAVLVGQGLRHVRRDDVDQCARALLSPLRSTSSPVEVLPEPTPITRTEQSVRRCDVLCVVLRVSGESRTTTTQL